MGRKLKWFWSVQGKRPKETQKWVVYALMVCFFAIQFAGVLGFVEPSYPKPEGNVNDFAGVLTKKDVQDLNALIDAVLKQTGTTFAVAIVNDHGDESIEIYSAKIYEKWGIGQKKEDKGLLLLVSLKEKEARIEVGYGLEGVITDGRAGECLDKMTPYFKNQEYGPGIYSGLWNAAQYIAKAANVKLEVKPLPELRNGNAIPPIPSWAPFLLIPFGIMVLASALLAIRGTRCPRCKAKLTSFDRVIEGATYQSAGLAVKVQKCPVCGYTREKPYKINPLVRPPMGGGFPPKSQGPFFGGFGSGGRKSGGGFSLPKGFGGGRSGGGGATRKW